LEACHQIDSALNYGQPGKFAQLHHWLAVQTRPRYEKKVSDEFTEKAIQNFLPLLSIKHQWSDRKKTVLLPLFPGYIFVRIAPIQGFRVSVLRTSGVINLVGARGIGTPIPDHEIDAIHKILSQQIPFSPYPFMRIGQAVRIRGGALDGIRGVLTKVNGDLSLVISVELIQRSIAMRVSGFDIEAV
jgi:transcription antitermination factor NusG